ncbi:hypothetical protein PIB30_034313, partial [Stylosanthes scabra]|nr:hypothetical protein [Stylosanthes scabra]
MHFVFLGFRRILRRLIRREFTCHFKNFSPPNVFVEFCVGFFKPTETSSSNSESKLFDENVDTKSDANSVGFNPT